MTYPTIVSKIRRLLLAIAILPVMAYAQTSISTDKLNAISDEMYQQGNENYILVDAIKDGVIDLNERYNFTYTDGHIQFNGEDLEPNLSKAYEDKMARLLATTGKGLDTRMYYRGGGIKVKDIMDEKSTFRKKVDILKHHEEMVKRQEEIVKEHEVIAKQHAEIAKQHEVIAKEYEVTAQKQTAYTNKIINAMYADKLIASKDDLKIKWNYRGVFVNGKKLKGEMADKYSAMFEKETGIKPKNWDDGVSITCTP